jgi:diketogulonate reductase-like aldo/keto reductase
VSAGGAPLACILPSRVLPEKASYDHSMRWIELPGDGARLPVIGQGTYHMGGSPATRAREAEALRLGISLGMTLIDTAEFYAGGRAEAVVGDAVADCRDRVFLVGKVWPAHAAHGDAVAAVRASLRRLRTDRLDAVLLHWPTRSVPLAETLRAFADLRRHGLVRRFGVSNFHGRWLAQAEESLPPGERIAFNEVRYHVADRGIERATLPHARAKGQVILAYSPLGAGRLARRGAHPVLRQVAERLGVTPQQVALAWVVARGGVVAIPKAVAPDHVRANAAAGDLVLGEDDLARLDGAYAAALGARLPALPPYGAFFRLASAAMRAVGR